ncbi:MAG: U32 family peptidase [Desulfobacter sp.]|nr:U32 family peptidase [Desulfobacter sp.]
MKNKIELLAPGGDLDSIKAAIAAGADAIYCGLNKFNARNRAANINFDDLTGVIHLAHKNNCKVFLTLNILITGNEIPALVRLLNKLINTSIDGVIVQDFGLFYLLSKYFDGLKIHASTQLNTHNPGQIKFLSRLSANRVNLARELSISEIKDLALTGQKKDISTEVFVHGSYCIGFSGLCYMSSVHGGNSGNRGRCSQPCRDRYLTTPEGKDFPLNLKDNSAFFDLEKLSEAGVDSLKIEGRIKGFDYVYSVVNCWKKRVQNFYGQKRINPDNRDLYKVFNRDFSNAYLRGDIHKNMFIDSPRDNSIKQFSKTDKETSEKKIRYYEEKAETSTIVKNKIKGLSTAKIPLTIRVSGKIGTPLNVTVISGDDSFVVRSKTNLSNAGIDPRILHTPNHQKDAAAMLSGGKSFGPQKNKNPDRRLNQGVLLSRFKAVNDTAYYIEHMDLDNLQEDLFVSFKDLTGIKKQILSILSGSKQIFDPIDPPFLKKAVMSG